MLLMGLGLIAQTNVDYLGKADLYEDRNENFPSFRTHVDDYLQYAPIAGVITLNALGVRGENDFRTQMWLLAKSELLMSAIVLPLKSVVTEPRPDTGMPNSFPSGHTAQAFVAATFMHKEYGKEHPMYSVMAYGTAAAIGALRIMNNRHWSNDVLFGAGIGILSTNLIYLLHDNKQIRKSRMMAVPTYQDGNIGFKAIVKIK